MSDMLLSALASVSDARLPRFLRAKWARIAGALLAELLPVERTTAAVLATASRCINVPEVVRVLLTGVWAVYGDDPRVAAWTSKLVERARTEGHAPTVVELVSLLVHMDHFSGELSSETVKVLVEAANEQKCHVGLFDLAWYYDHRLGGGPLPARSRRFLHAFRVGCPKLAMERLEAIGEEGGPKEHHGLSAVL